MVKKNNILLVYCMVFILGPFIELENGKIQDF